MVRFAGVAQPIERSLLQLDVVNGGGGFRFFSFC